MRILLAPIKGITDAIYRSSFARHFGGVDGAVAPFVSTVAARRVKPSYLRDFLLDRNEAMPCVPQVLSKDADDFLFLGERIADLGCPEINWNLGCPTPMVAGKRRGSGLLSYPDAIDAILERVCGQGRFRLSIKTRLGRFAKRELVDLMPIFNRYPITELIIHPRLGVQMYGGDPDLDAFAEAAALSVHPLVYNGDITTPARLVALTDRFPAVQGWMIGRGLLSDPFLAQRIRRGTAGVDVGARLRAFHDELFRQYGEILQGPGHLLSRMKGIWEYLADSCADARKARKSIQKCSSVPAYLDTVARLFESGVRPAGLVEKNGDEPLGM